MPDVQHDVKDRMKYSQIMHGVYSNMLALYLLCNLSYHIIRVLFGLKSLVTWAQVLRVIVTTEHAEQSHMVKS